MKPTFLTRLFPRRYWWLLHVVLVVVLIGHFAVVAFSMLPANPLSHQYKYQLQAYMNPWFSQTWNLFAPNPIASNQRLLFQYEVYQKGQAERSGWVDVVEPLTTLKKNSYWSPVQRVLKHLSASTNEVIEVQNKAIKFAARQDSMAHDTLKTQRFLRAIIQSSPGHRAIVQYSRHTFRRMAATNSAWTHPDSVRVVYQVLNQEFPRFSKRELDYFDEQNSRYSHLISEPYRLYLARH